MRKKGSFNTDECSFEWYFMKRWKKKGKCTKDKGKPFTFLKRNEINIKKNKKKKKK